jgi:hypothetical protein
VAEVHEPAPVPASRQSGVPVSVPGGTLMKMRAEDQIKLYETELARLGELDRDLVKLWAQIPRYGWLALIAPIVWHFSGVGWAIVALLIVGALLATQAYLIGVRRNEIRWNKKLLIEDLAQLKAESERPPPT